MKDVLTLPSETEIRDHLPKDLEKPNTAYCLYYNQSVFYSTVGLKVYPKLSWAHPYFPANFEHWFHEGTSIFWANSVILCLRWICSKCAQVPVKRMLKIAQLKRMQQSLILSWALTYMYLSSFHVSISNNFHMLRVKMFTSLAFLVTFSALAEHNINNHELHISICLSNKS